VVKILFSMALVLLSAPLFASDAARERFISDWNRVVKREAALESNTIVVYVNFDTNPFAYNEKDALAEQFHPKAVNGQSCAELGVRYIQVRSRRTNEMLAGIQCRD
jgi:hypothetical protein